MARNIYYKKKINPLWWVLVALVAVLLIIGLILLLDGGEDNTAATNTATPGETTATTTTTTAPEEDMSPKMVVTGDGVNVRVGPSTEFDAVTSLNTGDEVLVLAQEGDWYRIDLNGEHYYVHGDFLADPNGAEETPTTTAPTTEVTTTTTDGKTTTTKKPTTTKKKYTDRYIDEDGMLQFKPGDNYVQSGAYDGGSAPWNLLLVNDWNPMEKGYDESVKMKTVARKAVNNSQKVDARMYEDLMAMLDAGSAYNIGVQSSYRPYATQDRLYWNKVAYYKGIYSDPVEIQTKAGEVVKRPGFSEHNTGLAVDLYGSGDYSLTSSFANTAAYKWLMEHCADYGFILRFPKGKESITGVIYEAWHFRYVGDAAIAHEIMDNGLCLEEYLEQTKQ